MRPSDKVYWFRVFLAIPVAATCAALGLTGLRGILFGLIVYVASYYLARYGLGIEPGEVGGEFKLAFTGFASYLVLWMLIWTAAYTLALVHLLQ